MKPQLYMVEEAGKHQTSTDRRNDSTMTNHDK